MRESKPDVVRRSKRLRSAATDAERRLWSRLRNRQIGDGKFVRQAPIGRFVVDFVCRERQLVIEVDGGQHNGSIADRVRDEFLRSRRYRVLRFWDNDVLTNTIGVCEAINTALAETPPHPDPLPASGERGKVTQ